MPQVRRRALGLFRALIRVLVVRAPKVRGDRRRDRLCPPCLRCEVCAKLRRAIWPQATVQLCAVHLIRASLRYAVQAGLGRADQRPALIYTAVDEQAAGTAMDAFTERWDDGYPSIVKLWRSHWAEFVPFLAFPPGVRRVIYTTNPMIESINARLRKVARNWASSPPSRPRSKCSISPSATSMSISGRRSGSEVQAETSAPSVHDRLRGTHPHTMTATITCTDGLTLPRSRRRLGCVQLGLFLAELVLAHPCLAGHLYGVPG